MTERQSGVYDRNGHQKQEQLREIPVLQKTVRLKLRPELVIPM